MPNEARVGLFLEKVEYRRKKGAGDSTLGTHFVTKYVPKKHREFFFKLTSENTEIVASRLPEWRRILCLNSQKICPRTDSQRRTVNLRRSYFLTGSNRRKYLRANKNKDFAKWACDQEGSEETWEYMQYPSKLQKNQWNIHARKTDAKIMKT